MPYDIDAIRKKIKERAGKKVDPDEFRPATAESTTEPIKYRFFVLPPYSAGDEIAGGKANKGLDEFYLMHGTHFINRKRYACPRIWDGSDCPICNKGFELFEGEMNKEVRREIARQWMPAVYYMVNIFFINNDINPEGYRGVVKYYNAPKTVFDIWTAAIMREDAGDPADPQAYGVFFDETAAFLFQLEVLKQGQNNSYKSSKFLAGTGPIPIVCNKDKKPLTDKINKILAQRIDLHSKVEEPNPDVLDKLVKLILDGASGDDAGFDVDESSPVTTPSASTPTTPTDDVVDTIVDESVSMVESASDGSTSSESASDESAPWEDSEDDEDIDALLDQLSD